MVLAFASTIDRQINSNIKGEGAKSEGKTMSVSNVCCVCGQGGDVHDVQRACYFNPLGLLVKIHLGVCLTTYVMNRIIWLYNHSW